MSQEETMNSKKMWAALKTLVMLHRMEEEWPVTVMVLSRKTGLSCSYIEQIFALLKKAGMVISTKGPGGGYIPADKPISVADLLEATQTIPDDRLFDPVLLALAGVSIKELVRIEDH